MIKRFFLVMLIMLLIIGLIQAASQFKEGERVDRYISITQARSGLATNSTCYALTPTTSTIVTVVARVTRTIGKAYVVNFSTNGFWVTSINYGGAAKGSNGCDSVRANGMWVEGIDTADAGGVSAKDTENDNRYYFPTNEAFYFTSGDDAASDLSLSLRVEDVWR